MIRNAARGWPCLALFLLATSANAQQPAQCIDLGPAKQFNVFVRGDYWGWSSDIEGSLGTGGLAGLSGYGVGARLPQAPLQQAIATGGDLRLWSAGVYGNASYGGTPTLQNAWVEGTTTHAVTFDFEGGWQALKAASTQLAQLPANGTTTLQWGGVFLTGNDPALNVFSVPAWAVASAWGFEVNVPQGSTMVVNVVGDGARFWYMGFGFPSGFDASKVIWNLPDVTWLQIEGVGVIGSVLAPIAWVTFNNGAINGQVFASGFDGQGQTNLHPFNGCVGPRSSGEPSLSLALSAPASATPGTTVTYAATVTNGGTAPTASTSVAVTFPDGQVGIFSLGAVNAGAAATATAQWVVPVPATRAANESSAQYIARLQSLDGRALAASAQATWTDASGASFGPLNASASTVERLPILTLSAGAASLTIQPAPTDPPTVLPGIVNGTFDSDLSGWTIAGDSSISTNAHSGSGALSLLALDNLPGTATQTTTVPAGGALLSVWYSNDCSGEYARVEVDDLDAGTTEVALGDTCSNTSWQQLLAGSFIGGHQVRVRLSVRAESHFDTVLFDDVQWLAPAAGTVDVVTAPFTVMNVGSAAARAATIALAGVAPTTLGTLAPGASQTLPLSAAIALPGIDSERADAYDSTLAAIDATGVTAKGVLSWNDGATSYGTVDASTSTADALPILTLSIIAPVTTLPFQDNQVTATVTNIGHAAALNASVTAALPFNGAQTVTLPASLAPGQSATVSFDWFLQLQLGSISEGIFAIDPAFLQQLDSTALVSELSLAWSDSAGHGFGLQNSAETIITLPIVEPEPLPGGPVFPGQTITADWPWRNVGSAAASAASMRQVVSGPASLCDGSTDLEGIDIPAHTSTTRSLCFTVGNAGQFDLGQLSGAQLGIGVLTSSTDPFSAPALIWNDPLFDLYVGVSRGGLYTIVAPVLSTVLTGVPPEVLPHQSIAAVAQTTNGGTAVALNVQQAFSYPGGSIGSASIATLQVGETFNTSLAWTVAADTDKLPGQTDDAYRAQLLAQDGASRDVTSSLAWNDEINGSYGPNQQVAPSTLRIPVLVAIQSAHAGGEPGQVATIPIIVSNVGSGASAGASINVTQADGSMAIVSVPPLAGGASTTVNASIAIPPLAARGAGEDEATYRARLAAANGAPVAATASLQWTDSVGTVYGPTGVTLEAVEVVPILELSLAGPPLSSPGASIQLSATVHSSGSAPAQVSALQVTLPDGSNRNLAVGQSLAPRSSINVPFTTSMPTNPPADANVSASVTWLGSTGDLYGPVSAGHKVGVRNAPPQVSAGPPQTVTAGALVQLSGAAQDDGLPAGGTLTTRWSLVSGPAVLAFDDATRLNASFHTSVAGQYVLQLSASDGELTATNRVIITVNPPAATNQPPVVSAGADLAIPPLSDTPFALQAFANVSRVTGIDWDAVRRRLVVSVNYQGGEPYNFATVDLAGNVQQLGNIAGITDELQLAVAPGLGAFQQGEIYAITSPGVISRISPDGVMLNASWVTIPDGGQLEGGLRFDSTGDFGGDLYASFPSGAIYRIKSDGTATRLAVVGPSLAEASPLALVPNDPSHGDLAGRMAWIRNGVPTLYSIGLDGSVVSYALPFSDEIESMVPLITGAAYMIADQNQSTIWTTPSRATINWAGGILATSEGGLTWRVRVEQGAVVVNQLLDNGPNFFEQTIMVPASIHDPVLAAQLTGTVSDDGLPASGTLTSQWSKVSGPGSVTFDTPSATSTRAVFSDNGAYVLRLSANDGELTGSADVHIAVGLSETAPPQVDAGGDQRALYPLPVTLTGRATPAAGSGALSYSWTQLSGPAGLQFSAPDQLTSTLHFAAPGQYALRLTATDGVLSAHSDVRVTSFAQAQLILSPSETIAVRGAPVQLSLNAIDPGTRTAISGIPLSVVVTGANPETLTATTDASGNATVTHSANLLGDDTLVASVSFAGAALASVTSLVHVLAAGQPISSTLVDSTLWSINASDVTSHPFDVLPGNGWFHAALPDIALDSTFGHDIVVDESGSSAGAIPTDVSGCNAGVFTGSLIVSAAGNVSLKLQAAAYMLGISGATRVSGPLDSTAPSNTGRAHLPVVAASRSGSSAVVVQFASAGVYPYELDAHGCAGPFTLGLLSGNPIPPAASIRLTANGATQASVGATQGVSLTATGFDGRPVAGASLDVAVQGVNARTFKATTDATGSATFSYQGTRVGTDRIRATATLGSAAAASNVIEQTWSCCAVAFASIPDQTVPFGVSTVQLTADASGFVPSNAAITYSWQVLSAAGFAVIEDPQARSTSVEISGEGLYLFQVTASIGFPAFSTTAIARVTVLPQPAQNSLIVYAGAPFNVQLPSGTASLNGQAGLGSIGAPPPPDLAVTWSLQSGPATVAFSDASSLVTRATFTVPGTYRLLLSATGGGSSATSTVDVIVLAAPVGLPVVSAGGERTVLPPWTTTLAGTASASLAPGQFLDYRWRQLDGPRDFSTGGFLTIGGLPANASTAIVAFPTDGDYTVEFGAAVHGVSGYVTDTAVIHVGFPQGLTVDAGAQQEITLPATATLQGTAAGFNVSTHWTQDSGPSLALLATPDSLTTLAVFPAPGVYVFRLTATDGNGATQSAITSVVVQPADFVNQPPVVSVPPAITATFGSDVVLSGAAADDGLPAGGLLTTTWTLISGPSSVALSDPYSLTTHATFGTAGTYVVQLTANDSALTASASTTVTIQPAVPALTADAGGNQSVSFGAHAQLNGTVSAGATASWVLIAGASHVVFADPTSPATSATFDFPGQYRLRLTATEGGRSAFAETIVTVNAPAGSAPAVSLDSPADGDRITKPTQVLATISEGVWKLEAALGGTDDGPQTFKTLATGTAAGAQQQLGNFDPTLELNGNWTLRVTAETSAGTTVVEAAVMVDGGLKMGPLSFAVTDMSVSAPGLPIALVRSYDTRNDRGPDFGNGWRLAVANVRIEKSGPIGRGWLESKRGSFAFPSYCLEETRPHTVTVTFPNGKVHRFAAAVTPSCQPLAPIETPDVIFSALDGTTSKLEILENGNTANVALGADGIPGTITLTDETAAIYNPRRYRLTLIDGTQYVINQTGGVETIVDRNGNSLTFNQQGILASNGKSVLFTRDPVTNLITAITDANGNSVQYQYDANGSLTSTIDRAGNQTQYHYDDEFRLVGVTDARGVDVLGAGYSADGRLSQMTNGAGATTSLAFDPDNLTASVADPSGNETQIDTDERGNPIRTTDPLGHVTTATFDGHDNKLTETDPLGHTTTWTYDANDNKLSETDPLGNTTSWTYNARSQVLTTADPLGHVTTNVYDEQVRALQFPTGNLLSTTDARGNTTSYAYDQFGNLTSMTDARGGVTSSSYDDAGRLLSQIDALGDSSQYTYDANGNQLTETRTRNGHSVTTIYTYDSNGRRIKTVAPDGAVTQTLYGPDGKVQSSIDALLRTTKYAYDDADRLTRTDYPDGTSTTQSYDLQGRRVSSTDRGGRTTQYTYDAAGRLTTTTMPDGSTRSTAYDAAGRVTSTTDELGHTTQTRYDAAGRRTQIIDALQNAASFTYDANGNQLTVTDPLGHSTTTTYDELNRAVRTTQADGTFETTEYDAQGNRSARVDAAGLRTEYGNDLLGRLIFVKDALGQYTRYAYDELGNRVSQTDANGHTTQFGYDDVGRRISRTLPMGEQETFTYYADGQLKTRTDFNGHTTSYAYDDAGRLVVRTPDAFFANEPAVQWTYYPSGRRKTMNDATGLTSYTYDARDRIVQRATPEGTLTYTYDAAGNRRTVRSDSGVYSVDYGYDALNRLATLTDNAPGGGATTYAYDAAGRLQSFAYPSGVAHNYTYDSVNRVKSIAIATALATLASFSYDLYPTGNRRSVTESSGRTVSWSYDGLWRLVGETIAGSPTAGDVTYSYDAVGNRLARTSSVPGLANQTSNYDADDRLAADGWDANGNTLASDGKSFSYDSENRLFSLNTSEAAYHYDGDGQLVGKAIGSITTTYLIDFDNPTGYSQIVEERTVAAGGGVVAKSYVYGPQRISMRDAGGLHYYGYDAHSGVRLLLDSSGNSSDTYDYEAFGNLVSRTGTTANDFTYRGEFFERSSGLLGLRDRWEDLRKGRFTTADRWGGSDSVPATLHRYSYVANNPIDLADPSGRDFSGIEAGVGSLGAYGGGFAGAALGAPIAALTGNLNTSSIVRAHALPVLGSKPWSPYMKCVCRAVIQDTFQVSAPDYLFSVPIYFKALGNEFGRALKGYTDLDDNKSYLDIRFRSDFDSTIGWWSLLGASTSGYEVATHEFWHFYTFNVRYHGNLEEAEAAGLPTLATAAKFAGSTQLDYNARSYEQEAFKTNSLFNAKSNLIDNTCANQAVQ